MSLVRIATRGSDLALCQARFIAERLKRELSLDAELVVVRTSGDQLAGSLAAVGGKGLFVKEIEEALLESRADLAVHSAKDLPARSPDGLSLVAFPERADVRDALVSRERGDSIESLPRGARVGTGSLRRSAQLRRLRPDLEIVPLRGNVPTRIEKIEREKLDAVVLACAGLARLGLEQRIDERIAPGVMLPAVGQGALALQARAEDPVAQAAAKLDDPRTAARVAAERAFGARLGADCNVPLAALAEWTQSRVLRLRALVCDEDGQRVARVDLEREVETPDAFASLGEEAAEAVIREGAAEILGALGGAAPT